jgi:sucrose-6-phosphate hydrolase SacC (GH32 family)
MTPTNKLRFVDRGEDYYAGRTEHGDRVDLNSRRVLQQWHEYEIVVGGMNTGEWRDVPLENEE